MRKKLKGWVGIVLLAAVLFQAAPGLAYIDMVECMAHADFTGIGATSPNMMCNGWICEIDGRQYHIIPRTKAAVAGWAAACMGPRRAKIIGYRGPMTSPCGAMVPTIFACKVIPMPI